MSTHDPLVLQIGELAACAGLTVRALHYYDEIGLLRPSARAASGYRVYDAADVSRLYQIQALRQCGLALPDIAKALAGKGTPMPSILARHIEVFGLQRQRAGALRRHLACLYRQIGSGAAPGVGEWKTALRMRNGGAMDPPGPR